MLMGDGGIRKLIESGVIENAEPENVGPVVYDLVTKEFYSDGKPVDSITLAPGDSVFVGSEEILHLPSGIACRVLLRNSRIRQGLSLDAPLYFPGHETRVFFRVTNVSADLVRLDARKGIASISFEDVGDSESVYNGAYSDEFDFGGLGDYRDVYKDDIARIDRKAKEVEGIEQRMYGNVIVLMGVFVGVFSLVNVNVTSMVSQVAAQYMLAMNLATVGSLAVLFALVSLILRTKADEGRTKIVIACVIAVVAFAAAWLSASCSL